MKYNFNVKTVLAAMAVLGMSVTVNAAGLSNVATQDTVIASNAKLQAFTNLGPLTEAQVEMANRPMPVLPSVKEGLSEGAAAKVKADADRKAKLATMSKDERKIFLAQEKAEKKAQAEAAKADRKAKAAAEKAEKQRLQQERKQAEAARKAKLAGMSKEERAQWLQDEKVGKVKVSATGDKPMVGMPSPIEEYDSLQAAFTAVKFVPPMPTIFPANFDIANVSSISRETLQVMLAPHDSVSQEEAAKHMIVYRVMKGTGDISGVHYQFDTVETQDVDGRSVTFKGMQGRVVVANWEYDGYAFSLYFANPVGIDEAQMVVHGTTINQEEIQTNFKV